MRRNRNGNGITDEELDGLLRADLKLSAYDSICVSDDLIARTLAAAERGDEPKTPVRGEENGPDSLNEAAAVEPAQKRMDRIRFSRNVAAAVAVLVVLSAGGYAFTNYLSNGKKSADSMNAGGSPTMAATMAAQGAEAEQEENGALDGLKSEIQADGGLPDTTAGEAAGADRGSGEAGRYTVSGAYGDAAAGGVETVSPESAVSADTDKKQESGMDDGAVKEKVNAVFTSLQGLALYANAIKNADSVTIGIPEAPEFTLTGDQQSELAEKLSGVSETAEKLENQESSGQEKEDWTITAYSGDTAVKITALGDQVEVGVQEADELKKTERYQTEEILEIEELLASFME